MVFFCRFGFQEELTLDDVRALINRKELKPTDLLQTSSSPEWKRARDIPLLSSCFPDAEQPLQPRKRIRDFTARFMTQPAVDPTRGPSRAQIIFNRLAGCILILIAIGVIASDSDVQSKLFAGIFGLFGIFAILHPELGTGND